MTLPVWAGPAIAAGISATSSLLGRQKSDANWRNEALQREFAQMGIQWRVKDAIAAGLHPLYALGGAGASFTPGPIRVGGEFAEAGQHISKAVLAATDTRAQELHDAQLELMRSQAGEADARAMLAWSEAARGQQERNARPGLPTPGIIPSAAGPVVDITAPGVTGQIKPKPREITSRSPGNPSATAGSNPAFDAHELRPGVFVYMPTSEEGFGESLENASMLSWPFIIRYNMDVQGKSFTRLMQEWFGIAPGHSFNMPNTPGSISGGALGEDVGGRSGGMPYPPGTSMTREKYNSRRYR